MPYGSSIVRKYEKLFAAILAALMTSSFLVGLPMNASANNGAADAFGYYWVDSNAPAPTVSFNWTEINGTGTDTGLVDSDADDWHGPFAIGFDFMFYGNVYRNLNVSTKGMVSLGLGTNDWSNDPIPSANSPNNFIVAYWDDLRPSNGHIYYQTIGSAPNRQFVIEWWNISFYGNQVPDSTFQIILNETGEIWLQYLTMDPSMQGQGASIGIENIDGTIGLQYSYNTISLSNNMSILIHPPEVQIGPDQTATGARASDVSFSLQVYNLQAVADSFDITYTSTLGWPVTLFNASGTTPLTDTNGDVNGYPDTGVIPASSMVTIIVNVSIPTFPAAAPEIVVINATSFLDSIHFADATLTVNVQSIFSPPHADSAWDTDGDGLFDWLVVAPQIDIGANGSYYVYADLYDSGMGYISSTSNYTTFSAGINSINLMFAGYPINMSGDNGPYTVNLYLYDGSFVLQDTDTHSTNPYLWSNFLGLASFYPPHSDTAWDTDGNGLYDWLVLVPQIDVGTPGNYYVEAYLYDGGMGLIDSTLNYTTFASGINSINLMIAGYVINMSGDNGPYTVYFYLYDSGMNMIDSDVYTTNPYLWSDFQGMASFYPPHSDSARDNDGDGDYDWLVLTPQFYIGIAGNYYVQVFLYDSGWGYIGSVYNFTAFSVGMNTINLIIQGYLVNMSMDNGPYIVTYQIYDASINLLDTDTSTTNPYQWTDFNGPAEFYPPHSDYGVDTNSDSTYNELVVEVIVSVTYSATYTIRGMLQDSFLTPIDYCENVIWLPAGMQSVPLTFNGWYINENGVNGPYTVELELLIGGVTYDTDTYLTAAYPWTAFDAMPPLFMPPWYENFELGTLGGSTGYNWTTSNSALSGVGMQTAASGIYSMYTMGGIVTLTSWFVDMSAVSQGEVRCLIQRGSDLFSEDPDGGEDLVIEYLNSTFSWNALETFLGSGIVGEIYVRNYSLPSDALHSYFQLRFRQTGGSGAGNDYWHIDDVYVGEKLQPPTFEPPHSDYGLSTDADLLFDYLIVQVMVNATVPSMYSVGAILYDSMMNEIQRTQNITYLFAGLQMVNLSFNGTTIYFHGVNGPYQVYLGLINLTMGMVVGTDIHTTGAYLWLDFESPAPFVPPWYEDFETGSLGGTTGFNWTTTDPALSGVGTYTSHSGIRSLYTRNDWVQVTSWLVNLSGLTAAEVRCWVQRGSGAISELPDFGEDLVLQYLNATGAWNTLETFPGGGVGGEIFERIYTLPADALHQGFRLRFTQTSGSGIDYDYWHIDDVYIGGVLVLADLMPPYSETPTDNNANGLYDWLIIHVPVNVTTAGLYDLDANLYDGSMNFIASYLNSTYLSAGIQIVDLMFYGGDINSSGFNGPYVVQFDLSHDFWGYIESDSYTTAAYLWSDFETPNNPPVADFTVSPGFGTFSTVFNFDATPSWDVEDLDSALEMRWDWENDGIFDTAWAPLGTITHQYSTSGLMTIRLQVRDSVLQVDDHYDSVTVDGSAPVTTAVYGGTEQNGWYSTDVTVDLNAVDDFIGVNATFYRIGTTGSWSLYSTQLSFTAEGQYTLQYYSDDSYSNVETVHTDTIRIDKTDPSTTASGYQYNVTLTASDNAGGSGINRTMYRIDAGIWQTYSGTFSAGSSGTHNVTYYSVDNAGNTETVKWIEVPITDSTDPITVIAVQGTSGLNGWYISAVTVFLNATDGGSGVESTNYRDNGGSWNSYTGDFDISSNGVHIIEYYSDDVAGNTESTHSRTVKIDAGAPVLVLTQTNGTSFAPGNVIISWVATDATSGIEDIRISIDGGAFQSLGNVSSTTLGNLAIGDHVIVVRAVDEAGWTTDRTLEFTVSTSAGGLVLDWTLLLIIIIAIAAGLLILFFLLKRRKKQEPAQAQQLTSPESWQTNYPPPPPPPGQ